MAAGKAIGNAIKELLEKFEINIFTTSGIGRAVARFGSEWFTTVVWYGALLSLVVLCFKYQKPLWSEVANQNIMQRLWLLAMCCIFAVAVTIGLKETSASTTRYGDRIASFERCPEYFVWDDVPDDVKVWDYVRRYEGKSEEYKSFHNRCTSFNQKELYTKVLGNDFDLATLKKHLNSQGRYEASAIAAIVLGIIGAAGALLYLLGMLLGWVLFGRRHIQGKQQ